MIEEPEPEVPCTFGPSPLLALLRNLNELYDDEVLQIIRNESEALRAFKDSIPQLCSEPNPE